MLSLGMFRITINFNKLFIILRKASPKFGVYFFSDPCPFFDFIVEKFARMCKQDVVGNLKTCRIIYADRYHSSDR